MEDILQTLPLDASTWWAQRRLKYNKGLAVAGVAAFIAYAIIGRLLVNDFEITLFTTLFQGMGYLIMMGVANLFYYLGPFVDKLVNPNRNEKFRKRLFMAGCVSSYALPFSIPLLIIILYSGKNIQ